MVAHHPLRVKVVVSFGVGVKMPSGSQDKRLISDSGPDDPLLADPTSEMRAIYRESEDLRRTGVSEDAAIARLEERLQQLSSRLDKNLAEKLAVVRLGQARASDFAVPMKSCYLYVFVMAVVVSGCILESSLGKVFVFSAASKYRAMAQWFVLFLAPVFAWMWFRLGRANHFFASRYPTWWVRWLVVYPLLIVLSSGMVVISPLGWLSVYGRYMGKPVEGIEARILALDAYHSNSRGCRQFADISIGNNSARVCLADVLSGRIPAVGEYVFLAGRVSNAGVFIDKVHAK
jgi:hypothetical protein